MLLLTVILLVTVAVGATLAYIVTVTDPLRNVFADANVSCSTTYDEETGTWIVTNDGDVEAYIRVAVIPYLMNESGDVYWDNPIYTVTHAVAADWTSFGAHNYYYYQYPLPAGHSLLFGKVNVDTSMGSGLNYSDIMVTVNAEAFQVGSAEALEDAWNVTYTENVGFAPVSECAHSKAYVQVAVEDGVDGAVYHKYCCTKCGFVYGFGPHKLDTDQAYTNNEATHSGSCVCGYVLTETPHDVQYTQKDGVTHFELCTDCGYEHEVACEYEYTAIENPLGGSFFHSRLCACGAGEVFEEHSLTWVDNGDGTHKQWCATCEYVEVLEAHSTTLETTETQHTYTCTSCPYTVTDNHGWQTVSTGAGGHQDVCTTCNYKTDVVPHDMSVFSYDAEIDSNETHTITCSGCDYSVSGEHHMSKYENKGLVHLVKCSDNCGYSYEEDHSIYYILDENDNSKHIAKCRYCDYNNTNQSMPHTLAYSDNGNGTHTVTCSTGDCPYLIEAQGHDLAYSDNGDGTHTAACTLCTNTASLSHTFGSYVKTADTHAVQCAYCTNVSTPVSHTYESYQQMVAPSCTTTGSETGACVCGQTHTRDIAVLGHDMQYLSTTAATCTAQGSTNYKCSRCSETRSDPIAIDPNAHNAGAAATCTTAQTCTRCGTTLANALGHNAGAAATCTTAQTCTRCGTTLANALGHNAGAAATCTTAQTCTRCGTVLANALGHAYNRVYYAPTPSSGGYYRYTCTRCGHSYTEQTSGALSSVFTGSPSTAYRLSACIDYVNGGGYGAQPYNRPGAQHVPTEYWATGTDGVLRLVGWAMMNNGQSGGIIWSTNNYNWYGTTGGSYATAEQAVVDASTAGHLGNLTVPVAANGRFNVYTDFSGYRGQTVTIYFGVCNGTHVCSLLTVHLTIPG